MKCFQAHSRVYNAEKLLLDIWIIPVGLGEYISILLYILCIYLMIHSFYIFAVYEIAVMCERIYRL